MTIFSKLKQIKDLRSQAKTIQSALSGETIHAEKGKARIVMDGNFKVLAAEVDETSRDDVKDAINDAVSQVQKILARKVQKGELKMPDYDFSKKS